MRVTVVLWTNVPAQRVARGVRRTGESVSRTALAVHHAQHPVSHVRRARHEQVVPARRRVAVRRGAGEAASDTCGAASLGSGTASDRALAGASQRRLEQARWQARVDARSPGTALREEAARASRGGAGAEGATLCACSRREDARAPPSPARRALARRRENNARTVTAEAATASSRCFSIIVSLAVL